MKKTIEIEQQTKLSRPKTDTFKKTVKIKKKSLPETTHKWHIIFVFP